jgi:uncharacterized cupin superfamily protein
MAEVKVVKPTEQQLGDMGVFSWPIWEKEASTFPWSYDQQEICYLLEGKVKVTPEGGAAVEFGKGDLVTFPQGMSCTWEIQQAVRKHYKMG